MVFRIGKLGKLGSVALAAITVRAPSIGPRSGTRRNLAPVMGRVARISVIGPRDVLPRSSDLLHQMPDERPSHSIVSDGTAHLLHRSRRCHQLMQDQRHRKHSLHHQQHRRLLAFLRAMRIGGNARTTAI